MKNKVSKSIFLLGSILLGSQVARAISGEVEVRATRDPLGHFDIQSKELKFSGVKKETMEADEIKISVDSLTTDIQLLQTHMREKLKCESKSECDFVSVRKMKVDSSNKGSGEITIKGVTKPFNFVVTEKKETGAKASFNINMKDFNITGINYLGVGVEDVVEIKVTVTY